MKNKMPLKGMGFYIIALVAVVIFTSFFTDNAETDKMPYSQLVALISEGKATAAAVVGNTVKIELKEALPNGSKIVEQEVPDFWMSEFYKTLDEARAQGSFTYTYTNPVEVGTYINAIMTLIMLAAMVFFVWMLYSRQSGEGKSAMNFGRSKARMNDPSKNKITFADVAGAEEEKHELEEVVDFLKNSAKYDALGAKIPRGILLVGPPGTGKTLLAKAVAGEAGVPFFSISGSDFVEMFVGVGASRVRDLFEQAKKHAPAIIFIDEIDAVGRHRGAGMGGGHDEREQTLNQLLVEMDGFGPNEAAIVMAATNRPDILDPALLRPGRFDRRITVMRPDIKGREEILRVHAKDKPLDADVNLMEIARITPGFTGADLANLLNEAALLAARYNKKSINYNDITEAVFKVMVGPEKKSRIISDHERRLTALHEAGHATVIRSVSETDRVERVSIIPAGGAGGYTAHKAHEDLYYATKKHLIAQIMIALGGRAAEEIVLGEISTGASSDLQSVNSIARDMVVKFGMSEKLGNMIITSEDEVFLGRDYGHTTQYSDQLASEIDEEVRSIIDSAYQATMQILRERRAALEAIADVLLVKEKIDEFEFESIYRNNTDEALRQADVVNKSRDQNYLDLLAKNRAKQTVATQTRVPETPADAAPELGESAPPATVAGNIDKPGLD